MSKSSVVIAVVALAFAGSQAAVAQTRVTLEDAVRNGQVSVKVVSRGGATGGTVQVDVQSKAPETLHVVVEPGTVLVNASASEQNMAVGGLKGELTENNTYRPGEVMVLADTNAHSFLLQAYCLDYAKKAPLRGRALGLASLDNRVARIVAASTDLNPTQWAVQLAIWMDRSGITPERAMQIYPGKITKVDVDVANKLLVRAEAAGVAGISPNLPADVRVEVGRLYSPNPAVRNAAVEVLGAMGARARDAVPHLLENILDRTTDRPLPPSVASVDVNVDGQNVDVTAPGIDVDGSGVVRVRTRGADVNVDAEDVTQALRGLQLPWLEPLISSLGEGVARPGQRQPLELNIPGLGGLNIRAPGVEIKDGSIRIEGAGGRVAAGAREPERTKYFERLRHEGPAVRKHAAWLLGTLRDPQAIPPLIEALEDPDAGVREQAAESLAVITGQEFGVDAEKWKAWSQTQPAGPTDQPVPAPPPPAPGDVQSPPEELPPPEISLPPVDGADG